MSKKNKTIVLQKLSVDCPTCGERMERRAHEYITPKMKKSYYFSEWDTCTHCGRVQHYERYKVWCNKQLKNYFENKEAEVFALKNL